MFFRPDLCHHAEKDEKLSRLLNKIMSEKERRCDELTRKMRNQWPAMGIHGDKSEWERDWVLNKCRHGGAPIPIATDVASRGLVCLFVFHIKVKYWWQGPITTIAGLERDGGLVTGWLLPVSERGGSLKVRQRSSKGRNHTSAA